MGWCWLGAGDRGSILIAVCSAEPFEPALHQCAVDHEQVGEVVEGACGGSSRVSRACQLAVMLIALAAGSDRRLVSTEGVEVPAAPGRSAGAAEPSGVELRSDK